MVILITLIGLVILVGLVSLFTEVENFGWATIVLLATAVVTQLLHIVDIISFMKNHTLEFLLYAAAYVAIGITWSFVKWFRYLHNFKNKFLREKNLFLTEHSLPKETVLSPSLFTELEETYKKNNEEEVEKLRILKIKEPLAWKPAPSYKHVYFDNNLLRRPLAANNKSKIIGWMSLWPFSMIGTLINDPVRRLFVFLFDQLKNSFQKISDYVFKDTEVS